MNDINELIELMFTMNRLTKEGMEYEKGSLSYIQLQTLAFISSQEGPIMREVAKYLNIAPPSATFLVSNLIELGLVNRIYDDNDKRVTRLIISSEGGQQLQAGFTKSKKHLSEKLSHLSIKERQNFILILKKLSLLINNK